MKKCYDEMLKAGGAMVSLVNRKMKHSLLLDMDLETFWWYSQESGMFANMAKEQGWKVDNEELSFKLDASKCFDEDSVEGNLLLDFYTQTKDFRLSATKEELQSTMTKLEKRTDGLSRTVYPCMFDVTTIRKKIL